MNARAVAISHAPSEVPALARAVTCGHCRKGPGVRCAAGGSHLARYQAAERLGVISRADLVAVVRGLVVVAGHVIVPDAAPDRLPGSVTR
jgi:hypothetical protein